MNNELLATIAEYNEGYYLDQLKNKELTGIKEMDIIILKQLDVKTLNHYCTSSKQIATVCNTKEFWIQKYLYDTLPVHLIKIFPKTYNGWMNMYRILQKIKDEAPTTLLINGIEKTRNYNAMNGIIYIDIIDASLLDYVLHSLQIKMPTDGYVRIILTYINKDLYNVTIKSLINNVVTTVLNTTLSYDAVLDIIMRCYYSTLTGNAISVRDENNVTFLLSILNINQFYLNRIQDPIYLYQRIAILDTMNYLDKEGY